ncbi:hypothetical protein [Streptomyces shaanxiensis]
MFAGQVVAVRGIGAQLCDRPWLFASARIRELLVATRFKDTAA